MLHVGPLGAGQKVKLVNNALFAAHIGLLAASVASFAEMAGDFVGKDVGVVRSIAAELGTDLGVLEDVINTAMKV